ncbi:YsnF/AvaK domain-containing protein [Citricoccus parietis]|uniref:YsnF/AvaK domain-containing protein n=1 Tax=Citricoccus parietis TaxID=592307 RepID=A0ABV5FXS7_9MICC
MGSVGQVYLDDRTNQPTFVTVKTGLFGAKETFVPISEASPSRDGLQVPFDKAFVKDAPNVEADGSLTPQEEQRIYEYYSIDSSGTAAGTGQGTAAGTGQGTAAGTVPGADSDAGHDTSGDAGRDVSTDTESVTARNEQLNVGTEVRETGRVRLRKHTYTDTETVEVPVSREEIVVEREPVDPDSAEARRETGDQDVEVTAHEEVPVVNKTATAEKVTVDKTQVQDTERVAGTVQHEDIEVEGDDADTGRRDRRN